MLARGSMAADWLSPQAQKKSATEEAEKEKKDEMKALEGQLAALKEMQAEAQANKVSQGLQRRPPNIVPFPPGTMGLTRCGPPTPLWGVSRRKAAPASCCDSGEPQIVNCRAGLGVTR